MVSRTRPEGLRSRVSGLLLGFWFLTTTFVALRASAGPILPVQPDRTVNEHSTLIVTNTASETNAVLGGTYTNTIIFNYANRSAFLADGWSFLATTSGGAVRNTEVTSGAVVSYDQSAHPNVLRIPCDIGDLWEEVNTSRNSIFRNLPPSWTTMQLALAFYPTLNTQQVHLALYQDDDNYVQAGFAHNSDLDPQFGQVATLIWENAGQVDHYFANLNGATSIWLRLDHDLVTGNITQLYSLNGISWNVLGAISQALTNPRLGIWVGGSPSLWTDGMASCDLQRLDVVAASGVLTYQLLNAPAGATIDTNGVITWTPSDTQGPGTNLITTVVTDDQQPRASATNSFQVVVNEINTAPVLPIQPDVVLNLSATLTVTNTAADTDYPPNPLTYQLLRAPTNAAVNANGVIIWAPSPAQNPSTNLFVTVVTDSNPAAINALHLSATNSFTVFALGPPWPVLPTITGQMVNEQDTLFVTNTAADGSLTVKQAVTNTFWFNYPDRASLLSDGWSYVATTAAGGARNTEITNGAVVSYNQAAHPGVLRIPCDTGDLWGTGSLVNNTRNSLFRNLPTNWLTLQVAFSFVATANVDQAHLTLYQDDDNYLQIGVAYNNGLGLTTDLETGGSTTSPPRTPTSGTNFWFRLDRSSSGGPVTGSYSLDGANWSVLGINNLPFANPRLALLTGSSSVPYAS